MNENYEEIVRNWYNKLRPKYLGCLTNRYPTMRLEDAENLYQDTFIAVQRNIMEGRVKEETSWSTYIIQIGLNMASKFMRHAGISDNISEQGSEDDSDGNSSLARKVERIIQNIPDEEKPLYEDPEALALLGDEIAHTPEPCNSIIRMFYYEEKDMQEIAQSVGYKNADTAKAKKAQCMKEFVRRTKAAFRLAGFNV